MILSLLVLSAAVAMGGDDWTLLIGDHALSLDLAWVKFATELGLHKLDDPTPEGILKGNIFELAELLIERKPFFERTYRMVKAHNAKFLRGETTWRMALNQFADLSLDEVRSYAVPEGSTAVPDDFTPENIVTADQIKDVAEAEIDVEPSDDSEDGENLRRRLGSPSGGRPNIPIQMTEEQYYTYLKYKTVDWRVDGMSVRNQKSCGSCWAFAAAETARNRLYHVIKYFYGDDAHTMAAVRDTDVSVQEVLSCSGGGTCSGGSNVIAAKSIEENGLGFERNNLYLNQMSKCHKTSERIVKPGGMKAQYFEPSNEADLAKLVSWGAVSATFHVAFDFYFYKDGVYDTDASQCHPGAKWEVTKYFDEDYGIMRNCADNYKNCQWFQGDHAITVEGFTDDYWIIKNSWGPNWGEKGYIYFKRHKDLCKIGTRAGRRGWWSWNVVNGLQETKYSVPPNVRSLLAQSVPIFAEVESAGESADKGWNLLEGFPSEDSEEKKASEDSEEKPFNQDEDDTDPAKDEPTRWEDLIDAERQLKDEVEKLKKDEELLKEEIKKIKDDKSGAASMGLLIMSLVLISLILWL